MKTLKLLIGESFLTAAGTYLYVLLVAILMNSGEQLFGGANKLWGTAAFLLIFILSAAITGGLVLGKPIALFLNDLKKNAIQLFICNLAWLFVFIALTASILALTK
jgi:hypothetical protein